MKVIDITLRIPYQDDFNIPAWVGSITGYTGVRVLEIKDVTEVDIENIQINSTIKSSNTAQNRSH